MNGKFVIHNLNIYHFTSSHNIFVKEKNAYDRIVSLNWPLFANFPSTNMFKSIIHFIT